MVLKAKYLLNDSTGTTAKDSSDNKIDLTNQYSSSNGWSVDVSNNGNNYSYEFTGTTDDYFYVDVSDWESDFTLALWVKYNGNTGYVFSSGDDTEDSFTIYNDGTDWKVDSISSSVTRTYTIGAVQLDKWQHIAITKTSSTLITYLDYDDVTTTHTTTGEPFHFKKYILGRGRGSTEFFNGFADSLWIYNEVLTATQIDNLFNFNDPSATSIDDMVSNIMEDVIIEFDEKMKSKLISLVEDKNI